MSRESYPASPILIVDDNKDFLKAIEFTLLSRGITNLECCQDSRRVVGLLEKKKYSLIFLDLFMPHISGEELLPKIVDKYPGIPVIVLTAKSGTESVVECMKHGAIDYLVKPFDNTRLINVVSDYLDFVSSGNKNGPSDGLDEKGDDSDNNYSKTILKINYLLRTGKAQLVIAKIAPVIKKKPVNKSTVDLFYALGQAYEKVENFEKAADIYCNIKKFNPRYPGIQQKLKEIDKQKKKTKT